MGILRGRRRREIFHMGAREAKWARRRIWRWFKMRAVGWGSGYGVRVVRGGRSPPLARSRADARLGEHGTTEPRARGTQGAPSRQRSVAARTRGATAPAGRRGEAPPENESASELGGAPGGRPDQQTLCDQLAQRRYARENGRPGRGRGVSIRAVAPLKDVLPAKPSDISGCARILTTHRSEPRGWSV